MNFFGFLALGVAIGLPIAVIGGGLGQVAPQPPRSREWPGSRKPSVDSGPV